MAILTPAISIFRMLLLAAAFCALVPQEARAQAQREYAVKAVFLYRFCQFTTWPPSSFNSPRAPIIIGVLGTDPFGPLLEAAVAGEAIDGRSIQIARLRGVDEARQCHIVFVPRAASGSVNALIAAVRGRGVLTVGETEGFLAGGGMISLLTEEGKVGLRINQIAVRGAALQVSSKLLRLATR